MKSKVWLAALEDQEKPDSVARKALRVAREAGLDKFVAKDGLVGILQHVGEGEGVGYIRPPVTRALAGEIARLGGKPFLTGSSTLYRGRRSNAADHIAQAYDHGFTPEAIGCPVIMCDGLRGADRVALPVPKAKHCRTAYLGSAVALMEGLVVVTHPTGHMGAGFGAAIKNVSMGLASRGGKMAMHHGSYPEFIATACTACGRCAEWCPEGAIVIEKKARLIKAKCVGCGQCLTVCPFEAIDFQWSQEGTGFQERMVEYCAAAIAALKGRLLYVNVIQHFQKGCDCMDEADPAICPDVGVVASRDLVAVDAATADLLERRAGRDLVREAAERDYRGMFAYAESLGLGRQDYELVEVR